MTRLLAAPAISRNVPRLALADRPTTLAVPPLERLPLAKGVPAAGRTRMFCQVNCEGLADTAETVYVIDVGVNAVTLPCIGTLPVPLILTLDTVGLGLLVSNKKPTGALIMIVPVPTSPLLFSE